MNINEAREIVKAQFAKANQTYTDDHCFEVYDNRNAAFDGIRSRAVNHECSGGCGRKLNTKSLMVRPLDYSKTDAEYIVVRREKSGYCLSCAPHHMKQR